MADRYILIYELLWCFTKIFGALYICKSFRDWCIKTSLYLSQLSVLYCIALITIACSYKCVMSMSPCLAVRSCGSCRYSPLSPRPQDFHHHPPFSIDAQFSDDRSLSLYKLHHYYCIYDILAIGTCSYELYCYFNMNFYCAANYLFKLLLNIV